MDGQRDHRFIELEEVYSGLEVYDSAGEKIGKVDYLFVDENDQPEYLGIKMDLLEAKFNLIPWKIARVDEEQRRIEVPVDKDRIKESPAFDDNEEITPEYEERVHSYYELSSTQRFTESGAYGEYYGDEERLNREEREGTRQPRRDLEDEDELNVQRIEEELKAGTREREAGRLNVRKRVRTDREHHTVPKKRQEVHVDRVSAEGREDSEAQIGEDEVRVPVVEEEVVV